MKIACLGWGSLIWRPEGLNIHRQWYEDGPLLPIEFTRQSKNDRLTLVITNGVKPVRTLWALMATDKLEKAKKSLLIREGIPKGSIDTHIGEITSNKTTSDTIKLIIQNWAKKLELDAVIWTNLKPKFKGHNDQIPTIKETLEYLQKLCFNKRKHAEEYIRRAPKQIDTDYRREFEKQLGWTFIE